jgi:hypothetical protein
LRPFHGLGLGFFSWSPFKESDRDDHHKRTDSHPFQYVCMYVCMCSRTEPKTNSIPIRVSHGCYTFSRFRAVRRLSTSSSAKKGGCFSPAYLDSVLLSLRQHSKIQVINSVCCCACFRFQVNACQNVKLYCSWMHAQKERKNKSTYRSSFF